MRESIKMLDKSKNWTGARAEAAIDVAKYKERPDVHVHRIKILEVEQRK